MILKIRDKKTWDVISRASLMGTNMVACTVVGLVMGYFLDRWLNTAPWMLLLWLLLGIVAGFRNIYLEAMEINQSQADDNEPTGK